MRAVIACLKHLFKSIHPFVGLEPILLDICFQSCARIMHQECNTEQVGGNGVGCGNGVGGVVGCTGQTFVRIHG